MTLDCHYGGVAIEAKVVQSLGQPNHVESPKQEDEPMDAGKAGPALDLYTYYLDFEWGNLAITLPGTELIRRKKNRSPGPHAWLKHMGLLFGRPRRSCLIGGSLLQTGTLV